MLSIDGKYIRSTSDSEGSRFDELMIPYGVCIDTNNQWVIVSDCYYNRLVVYDINNFQFQRLIGGRNSQIGLSCPLGICCDENNLLYVCDRKNHRIVVVQFFDRTLIHQWGRKGTQQGEFDLPDSICYREGILAVSDSGNHRIQVFTLCGQCLFTFGKPGRGNTGEFHYPRGVAIDNKGFFYGKSSFST